MNQKLSLSIESCLSNVCLVGASVRGLCDGVVRNVNTTEIELCVVEGVNNAIEHAYEERSDGVVSVDVTLAADFIEIAISDRGKTAPDNLLTRSPAPVDPDPADILSLPEGGFGFPILKSCMDDLWYDSINGINTLTMRKSVTS
tara:strand:+ start:1876 stop:2307 length:432 start_codon:yes stop_codon:yes gene_type:complete